MHTHPKFLLPPAHQATGDGVAVACNSIMGILSAVIATVAYTSNSVPIYVCAALYIAMAAVAISLPI